MLRPSKVVKTEIIDMLWRYDIDDLMICKHEGDDSKYDIYECNHFEDTYKYLVTLSIEELRYVAEYNKAIIAAVKAHYDSKECSFKEIIRIGIPTAIKFDELKTSIQIAMEQALANTKNINELLDTYTDILEMAESTLNIFRTISKMNLEGDN